MSIKLDWELTDAPDGEEKNPLAPARPAAPQLGPAPAVVGEAPRPAARPSRRWLPWAALIALFVVAAGTGAWLFTRSGWQRVTADVSDLVRYEEAEVQLGHSALVMAVQDPSNTDWLALREDELARQQSSPLPMPMLRVAVGQPAIGPLEPIEADVIMAAVDRQFETPTGQALSFRLPQFYRRNGAADWLRSAPPGSFWGQWLTWESPHLVIRYSERDTAFMAQAAPALEMKLALACAGWQDACFNATPAHLYLSGFVGSIGYDPLNNVEVRISLGAGSPEMTGYYLSVPSPQIAGIPQDPAGEKLLIDYLAVRLIASLAQHATRDAGAYQTLTALAIQTLQLTEADPGYVAAAHAQIDTAPSGGQSNSNLSPLFQDRLPFRTSEGPARPPVGQPIPATLGVRLYHVVAGDSLSSIADRFDITVADLVLQNDILDPDNIQIDTWLTIPADRPPQP
ncbi:MAG: LysM peptidoglycan-binding domain-containing protein [Anaerolineales bacterium]